MSISLITYSLSKKYTDEKIIKVSEDVIAEAVSRANAYTDTVATQIEWKTKKVNELPPIAQADEHTIYFVPASSAPQYDGYFEYIIIEGEWEVIGRTVVDMSNYFTKQEVMDYVEDHKYILPSATGDTLGGVIIDENTIDLKDAGKIAIKSVTDQEILDLF